MITFWQELWFVIIYFILFVYSLLDGFDLGIGLLLPFYRQQSDRKTILNSIFPFWDGNELWLIIGATLLFAISPMTFSSMLSGFYPGLMFIILAITCRAVSFEFLYQDMGKRIFLWQTVFFISTLVMSAGGMMSISNLIQGYPLNKNGEFSGNILIFLRPYTIITTLYGMMIFAMHGISYIILKNEGAIIEDSVKKGKIITWINAVACAIFIIATLIIIPESRTRLLFYSGSILMIAGIFAMKLSLKYLKTKFIFLFSSVCIAGFWILTGGTLFPNIIKASNDSSLSITIYNGSSSLATLKYLAIFTLIGMVFITVYTVFIYKVFRKKTKSL